MKRPTTWYSEDTTAWSSPTVTTRTELSALENETLVWYLTLHVARPWTADWCACIDAIGAKLAMSIGQTSIKPLVRPVNTKPSLTSIDSKHGLDRWRTSFRIPSILKNWLQRVVGTLPRFRWGQQGDCGVFEGEESQNTIATIGSKGLVVTKLWTCHKRQTFHVIDKDV